MRYHAHTRPHLFFPVVIALASPLLLGVFTPDRKRRWIGEDAPLLPETYPIPNRKREQLTGYDD